MKNKKNEYPNPVLAPDRDDYKESCHFTTIISEDKISVDDNNIIIPIEFSLICDSIQTLIDNKKAAVIVSIKSSTTSYGQIFPFPYGNKQMKITVPKYSVAGNMKIQSKIVASENIQGFEDKEEFNSLYFGSVSFEIRKGDLLANDITRNIYVDTSELEKPISSIFTISCNDEQDHDIVPVFENDKIEIRLKNKLMCLYRDFNDFNNGILRRYINAIIVYPVLVEAIMYVIAQKQNENTSSNVDYSEKRWFRAIELQAQKKGFQLDNWGDVSPVSLADSILGNIAQDALSSFKDTMESEMNSGETQLLGGVD